MRGVEFAMRLELRTPDDIDDEAIRWMRHAYAENSVARPRAPSAWPTRPSATSTLRIVVEGFDLPGPSCHPDDGGRSYDNIHVGLCSTVADESGITLVPSHPWTVVGAVRGDAATARWELAATLRRFGEERDLIGPAVLGRRGARHIGLAWGVVSDNRAFRLFRKLGLRLSDVDPALIDEADRTGRPLVARLGLTDRKGNPRCAGVPPDDVTWSVG